MRAILGEEGRAIEAEEQGIRYQFLGFWKGTGK